MSQELEKTPQTAVTINDPALVFHAQWNKWMEIANTVYKANMLNTKVWDSPSKIMLGFMKCHELGLPAMTGIMGMYIVNGKVSLEVNMMRAKIDSVNACAEKKIDEGDGWCKVYTKRKRDGQEFTSMFTIADARTAGLLNKDNWKNYPKDCLRARAEAINYRQQFSDVLHGLTYIPDELGLVTIVDDKGTEITDVSIEFDEKIEFERINNELRRKIEKHESIDDIKTFIENNLSDIQKISPNKRSLIVNAYNTIAKKHGENYAIRFEPEKPVDQDTTTKPAEPVNSEQPASGASASISGVTPENTESVKHS